MIRSRESEPGLEPGFITIKHISNYNFKCEEMKSELEQLRAENEALRKGILITSYFLKSHGEQ